MFTELNPQHEYEMYVDECRLNNKEPIIFSEWFKYFEVGELYLLEE